MAKQTVMQTVCDMKHRGDVEAAGTVEIAIDGRRRKVDVCAEHLKAARTTLRPWLAAAQSAVSRTRPASRSVTSTASRRKSAEVRQWAEANGYELPGRGRIPAAVHDAYRAALG